MSFWGELRRRNVFKVGAAYAIVAWLIVQIVSVMFPALQLRAWTVTFVTALLIVGFPVALLLAWAYEVTPQGIKRTRAIPLADGMSRMTGQRLNYGITGLLAIAVIFLLADRFILDGLRRGSDSASDSDRVTSTAGSADGGGEPVRFIASLPRGVSVTTGTGLGMSSLALSPDGRTLVIGGTGGGNERLYARRLDRIEATPIPGTEGGRAPFFSPDGAWIGFFANGSLQRVPVRGGAPIEIAAVEGFPSGASWGPDDRIVFSGGCCSALHTVSVDGSRPALLTTLEDGEEPHSRPEMLPGGRALVYDSGGWIHALDIERGRSFPLIEGRAPEYTASGHLLFARDTVLLAAPFDPEELDVTGPVVPVLEDVATANRGRTPQYAISDSGTLAYLPANDSYALVLVAPDGTERRITAERPLFENPRFAHDGRQVVAAVSDRTGQQDLWLYDLDSGTEQRLTFGGGRAPVWTPDGTAVTFSHLDENREQQGIYTKRVDGRGEAERVLGVERFHWLIGWTPDRRTLALGQQEAVGADGTTPTSIIAVTDGERRYVIEPGDIWGGRLSPSGEWLAYYERVAGRFEVYVTPFPEADTRYLITDVGGRDPAWAPDGTEVYYRSGDRLMAAEVDTTAGVRVVSRRRVVEPFAPPSFDDYDIDSDGRTLVLVRPVRDAPAREVTVVIDWFAALPESMP